MDRVGFPFNSNKEFEYVVNSFSISIHKDSSFFFFKYTKFINLEKNNYLSQSNIQNIKINNY